MTGIELKYDYACSLSEFYCYDLFLIGNTYLSPSEKQKKVFRYINYCDWYSLFNSLKSISDLYLLIQSNDNNMSSYYSNNSSDFPAMSDIPIFEELIAGYDDELEGLKQELFNFIDFVSTKKQKKLI